MSVSGAGGTLGTNVAPISFPGIVSGLDYNAIIQKLTQLSLAPEVSLNAAVVTLNNANTELIKINGLLQSVQNSLDTLSNPNIYQSYNAASSNTGVLTAQGITGESAVAGVYTITKVQTATSTSVLSCTSAGYGITDKLTSGTYAGQNSDTVPLVDSYAAVTPTNGSGSQGQVTVDGVTVSYNVNTQSLDTILNNITAAVKVSADSGFLATLVNGVAEFTSSDQPISLGSSSDQGNLLDVLRLSNAQLNNTSNSGSIAGTANVGGIDLYASFDTTTQAGYKTGVTAGYFTINGVKITVAATQSSNDILNEINGSGAGVVASYNSSTGQLQLTSTSTGPQGIVLGAGGDTSNFLAAAGLTSASGAQTTIGQQAEVDIQTSSGGTQKYYSSSNAVTTAIPGIQLNLQGSYSGGTPVTVTVTQSSTQLVNAVTAFMSAYNAAVTEINAATAAPVVLPASPGSGGQTKSVGGGVLWNNANAQTIVQELTQITSGFLGSSQNYQGSTNAPNGALFSLSQIGINISDSFSSYTTSNNRDQTGNTGGSQASGQNGAAVQSTTYQGTDGTLQSLSTIDPLTKISYQQELINAFQSNPSGVQGLLGGSQGLATQLGTYLTSVTGAPTILDSGPVGVIPKMSVIQDFEDTNTDAIDSYQQQIQQLTDNANQQANVLRQQFVASETLIAGLQAEQQQLAAALGFTVSSSSSHG